MKGCFVDNVTGRVAYYGRRGSRPDLEGGNTWLAGMVPPSPQHKWDNGVWVPDLVLEAQRQKVDRGKKRRASMGNAYDVLEALLEWVDKVPGQKPQDLQDVIAAWKAARTANPK